ncbi:helix-turn-helix transcriptional regulator [Actinopolymorpha pittospori]|uniref:AraC-like DNA-binding protein n=1 Tax=Actinopolymorpha pittospori TaxID=648752 RepID=A0A927MN87_9ACTN|nr:helix-turn-helix domain-containing protein [Actinopolymorpha pittospori]MBE1603815.1 AraC-like DNA-binding protein [Actinopolymorpha pittospori]
MDGWAHYLTPTAAQRRLGMVCLGAGHKREDDPCPPRVLTSYAAVFVVEGRGWLEWGHGPRRAELSASSLFWLFPGVPHTYGPHGAGWQEIWLLFEGPAAAAYEELGYLSRSEPVVRLADPFPARAALDRLLDRCRQERPGTEVEAAHAVHSLILGVRNSRSSQDSDGDTAVLAALREGACRPLSVHEHAHRLGLSLASLRRAVRRGGGCSPKEYVLRIRLNRAKELLAESDLTIAEIARRVGHDDAAYFTRMFSRRAGMPPGAFRRQQRRPRQPSAR